MTSQNQAIKEFKTISGVTISYILSGVHPTKKQKRSTIVLLHGAWSNSSVWLTLMKQLQGTYSFIAPDLRNRGSSSCGSMSIENCAEDLIELLMHEKINDVILVGNSFGSNVANKIVEQRKLQGSIRGLILCSPLAGNTLKNKRWFQMLCMALSFLVWPLPRCFPRKRMNYQHLQNDSEKWMWLHDVRGIHLRDFVSAARVMVNDTLNVEGAVPTILLCGTKDQFINHNLLKSLVQSERVRLECIQGHHLLMVHHAEKLLPFIEMIEKGI